MVDMAFAKCATVETNVLVETSVMVETETSVLVIQEVISQAVVMGAISAAANRQLARFHWYWLRKSSCCGGKG